MVILQEMREASSVHRLAGDLGRLVTSYFGYHAVGATRPARLAARRPASLRSPRQQLAATEAERDALAHKVAGARPGACRSRSARRAIRATLDLVAPDEIVILQSPARRLAVSAGKTAGFRRLSSAGSAVLN